jgi:hypothetical protein
MWQSYNQSVFKDSCALPNDRMRATELSFSNRSFLKSTAIPKGRIVQ